MTLRVDWLEAPVLSEADLAGLAGRVGRIGRDGDELAWLTDPVRGEWVVGIGCALDGTRAAAAGLAALARATAAIDVDAQAEPGARIAHGGALWIGAGPFDPARASGGVWGGSPAARWVVPRVALRVERGRDGDRAVCAVAGAPGRDEARRIRDDALRKLGGGADGASDELGTIRIRPEESPAAFRGRVAEATEAIGQGDLQKVVLARACHAMADGPFDPGRVHGRLALAEPDAVRFSFPIAGGVMLGASPERLVRVDGDRVVADAVAGSAARASCPRRDQARAAALVESKKDQEEHAWVRDAIHGALSSRVSDLQASEAPRVLSTGGLHHLHTPFRARRGDGSVLELAAAMQPTPAVGGVPTEAALEWLRDREPLARGCYAGAFGWTGLDGEGAVAVALRSALLRGNEAFVFGGAGIVEGSDPDEELEETRLKIRAVLDALVEV